MTQMPLAEHDHMIKTLALDRADQSLRIAVLPRRSRGCRSVADAHRSNVPRACKPFSRMSRAVRRRPIAKPASCNSRVINLCFVIEFTFHLRKTLHSFEASPHCTLPKSRFKLKRLRKVPAFDLKRMTR